MTEKTIKNWVITGSKGNVGAALVETLTASRTRVFGIDYGTEQHVDEVNQFYTYLEADLIDIEDVQRVFNEIQIRVNNIHVWINVVGGFAIGTTIEDTTAADWSRMMLLNFQTALNCSRVILQHMKENEYGRIINFGSVAAEQGMAAASPYTVSKAAVMALTKTTALEGKNHGIFCNAIVPTIIDTLQNRAAMPDADFSTWTAPTAIANEIISVVNSERNGEMIYV